MAMAKFREKKRKCIECNASYTPYQERQTFCSGACRVKHYMKLQRAKVAGADDREGKLQKRIKELEAKVIELEAQPKQVTKTATPRKPSKPKGAGP